MVCCCRYSLLSKPDNFVIGADNNGDAGIFQGNIAKVKVYNFAGNSLTPTIQNNIVTNTHSEFVTSIDYIKKNRNGINIYTNNTTPITRFSLSDLDINDNYKYTIDLAKNINFDPLYRTYTSSLNPQDAHTYTPSGLPDSTYFLRIYGEDHYTAKADKELKSFNIDTTPPVSNILSPINTENLHLCLYTVFPSL